MKQIDNKHHKKLCEVFEKYCSGAVELCSATMKDASLDDSNKNNKVYVYNYENYDMNILKLDEFSKIIKNIRTGQGYQPYIPSAVDAVCIDFENNWYLIEFKNQEFGGRMVKSIKDKMLSSLWILFYAYSITGNISCISDNDIIKFAKEKVTYIVVCSKDKNLHNANLIHQAEEIKKHYTPNELQPYINYYFKDVYLYTEYELRKFIVNFK